MIGFYPVSAVNFIYRTLGYWSKFSSRWDLPRSSGFEWSGTVGIVVLVCLYPGSAELFLSYLSIVLRQIVMQMVV